MKSAYDQLTAITDGQDAVVEIRVSTLSALIDAAFIDDNAKQFVIDQAVEQLRRRVIVDPRGEHSFMVRTAKPEVQIVPSESTQSGTADRSPAAGR